MTGWCAAMLLAGCGSARKPDTPAPAPPKKKPPAATQPAGPAGASKWFGPEPWVYRWQDTTVEGLEETHFGTVVFLRDGPRVLSYAWPLKSENNWPTVEGSGAWDADGRVLRLAYRSASGLPAHDFYHAQCEFYFDETGKKFEVEFRQRINDEEEQPMEPGAAKGARAEDSSKLDRDRQESLRRLADDWAKRGPPQPAEKGAPAGCAVLRHVPARGDVFARHGEATYYFCCPSCRDVFLRSPETFLTAGGERGTQKEPPAGKTNSSKGAGGNSAKNQE